MLPHLCSVGNGGEGDLPGLHPSYPFVPLLKAKHVVALASTQVPYEPTIPNQNTTHSSVTSYGIFAWLSSWQVRVYAALRCPALFSWQLCARCAVLHCPLCKAVLLAGVRMLRWGVVCCRFGVNRMWGSGVVRCLRLHVWPCQAHHEGHDL